MILFKIAGTAWMVVWFLLILKITIEQVNAGAGLMPSLFALQMTWFLVGFLPVAIVNLAWHYIS
ncbi:hypothetical protein J8631_09845 [Serratia fonticola]|uniref:hypothetical protein n=1 Tax=Serratia fonticola TaxID=47917 RepID=UPI001AEAA9E0|nr:hypothetical protein [Serratia fonticola]MBP1035861.1 hypothetical protein [Serratia fonticola]